MKNYDENKQTFKHAYIKQFSDFLNKSIRCVFSIHWCWWASNWNWCVIYSFDFLRILRVGGPEDRLILHFDNSENFNWFGFIFLNDFERWEIMVKMNGYHIYKKKNRTNLWAGWVSEVRGERGGWLIGWCENRN